MTSKEPSSSERVTIAIFAHVHAAVAEEWPLEEVLSREEIGPAEWGKAQIALRQQIASTVAAQAEYEEALVLAQDRLAREVAPIDREVIAWLSLLGELANAPAPFAYLTKLGLRLSDIARLRRKWNRRAQEDEELRRKMRELGTSTLPALPPLQLGRASYVRLTQPAPTELVAETARETLEFDGMGIDRLAALDGEVGLFPDDAASIRRRYGIDAEKHKEIAERLRAAFARDPALERDYRRLLSHHERRLKRRDEAPSSPDSEALAAPRAAEAMTRRPARKEDPLDGTQEMRADLALPAALPFQEPTQDAEDAVATALPRATSELREAPTPPQREGRFGTEELDLSKLRAFAMPFRAMADQGAEAPAMTLEQYAEFRARLSVFGEDNLDAWKKFGVLSVAAKETLAARFAARFREDSEAQRQFVELVGRWAAELRSGKGRSS